MAGNGSTAQAPVRIAVIGGGLIGPRHCQHIQKSKDAVLVALVDPAPYTAKIASELSVPYYTSVVDLLASSHRPDGAIICTPNHTHVAVAKELVAAGVHVLVEKPLSTDQESAIELIEQARKHGVKLLVGHHRRFSPYLVATKDLLPTLGDITLVNGLWVSKKADSYFDSPTEWRKGKAGGAIMINLVHEVDSLQYLFGPIVRVHAEKTIQRRGFEADEGAVITLRFENGIVGSFAISDNGPSPHNFESGTGENPVLPATGMDFYRIFGTRASLSVPDITRWSYDGAKDMPDWRSPLGSEDLSSEVHKELWPFDLQLANFVGVIRGEQEPICNGEVGLRALVSCDAIKRAANTGETINI